MIGDLVQFTDIEKREIIITGRIKQFLSLCGEHLSLDNINTAIDSVCKSENIDITEFTIIAKEEELGHHWFLGIEQAVDKDKIMQLIDAKICELNDDYRSCRKMNLKEPEVTVVSPNVFYKYLESIGKSGSQFKFPRVLNKNQCQDWFNFVSETH